MKPIAEIFSQGHELITGHIIDSNAAWLSEQLFDLGFQVKRHTTVGDELEDLIELFAEIAGRADCCICTGGLGPTVDDLTTEAVSIASGLPLKFDNQAYQSILQYFAVRDRPMPEANRKQAYLPENALRIDNPYGTAPGFSLQFQRCWFVFLPGVPSEMQGMYMGQIRQQLLERFNLYADSLVILRSVGMGESAIQQCLSSIVLPKAVELGFRAAVDEVQTKLLFSAGFPALEREAITMEVARQIGDSVFSIDGLHGNQGGLLDVIDRLMQQKTYQLAILETFTQGLTTAKCITKSWLTSAEICFDVAELGLKWQIEIDANDPEFSAAELAKQLKWQKKANLALVQLFSAEQDYHEKNRSVVLYNVLSHANGMIHSRHKLSGSIQYKQNQAALLALDLLRRYLQNKCP